MLETHYFDVPFNLKVIFSSEKTILNIVTFRAQRYLFGSLMFNTLYLIIGD